MDSIGLVAICKVLEGMRIATLHMRRAIMLDVSRLLSIQMLSQSGWTPTHRIDIKVCYSRLKGTLQAQVPIEEIFPSAREIIESLDGIKIKNSHPELGLGDGCNVIEFNFFEYDTSSFSELVSIQGFIKKRVLFIGSGYDIIGDWCVDEDGAIYFYNVIRHSLHMVSKNIYQFLEQDIYNLADVKGNYILS